MPKTLDLGSLNLKSLARIAVCAQETRVKSQVVMVGSQYMDPCHRSSCGAWAGAFKVVVRLRRPGDDVEPMADADRSYLLHLPTTIDHLPSHHASTGKSPSIQLFFRLMPVSPHDMITHEHPARQAATRPQIRKNLGSGWAERFDAYLLSVCSYLNFSCGNGVELSQIILLQDLRSFRLRSGELSQLRSEWLTCAYFMAYFNRCH